MLVRHSDLTAMHIRASSHILPLEVWHQIFAHACTDGGRTGLSLSLVSNFFHNASHPLRFHSLSFTSLHQIHDFLAYVDRRPSFHHGTAPRVFHLLLSFLHVSPYGSRRVPVQRHAADSSTLDDNMWYRARRLREEEKAAWDQRYTMLVPRLMQLVAPHLETLVLMQSDGFAIPVIQQPLPHLRELTLLIGMTVMLNEDDDNLPEALKPGPATDARSSGTLSPPTWALGHRMDGEEVFVDTTDPATLSSGDTVRSARFPSLERLHVVCGRYRDWTLHAALEPLPWLAPALTHLRISNATYTHGQDDCIPLFLNSALGFGVPVSEAEIHGGGLRTIRAPAAQTVRPPAMPELRRVVVHSVPPPPPGCQFSTPHKDYGALVDAVGAVVSACDRAGGARVRWTESERAKNYAWERWIEAQWVDRIEGGRGCWDLEDVDSR